MNYYNGISITFYMCCFEREIRIWRENSLNMLLLSLHSLSTGKLRSTLLL